jgi:hypothetical protein
MTARRGQEADGRREGGEEEGRCGAARERRKTRDPRDRGSCILEQKSGLKKLH